MREWDYDGFADMYTKKCEEKYIKKCFRLYAELVKLDTRLE